MDCKIKRELLIRKITLPQPLSISISPLGGKLFSYVGSSQVSYALSLRIARVHFKRQVKEFIPVAQSYPQETFFLLILILLYLQC